ncbi:hypothetical protein F444_00183, partial [Phytophthora nicotianae P1976]
MPIVPADSFAKRLSGLHRGGEGSTAPEAARGQQGSQSWFETPWRIVCIAYGSHVVVANTKAMVRLMIHTAAGVVEIAEPVPCLIVDTQDEELIVGRDVLSILGIDVERQLEQLANRQQDDATGDPFELEVDGPP